MRYQQRNPLPIPAAGEFQHVQSTIDAVFDWQYELKSQKLMELYEKGKAATWNAADIDWSIDIEKMVSRRQQRGGGTMLNKFVVLPRLHPARFLAPRAPVELAGSPAP